MGLVDPNAPTQIDPAPSSQYDAYGNPIEPAHYAQPVQPRYVAPAPPVQPAQYMRPVEPVEPVAHPHYVQPVEPIPPLQPREVVYSQPAPLAQAGTPIQPAPPVEPGEPLVPANRAWDVYRTSQVIYFALAVLETLLIIRIILRLLAANASAPFTELVYGITYPFVALFSGVFSSAGAGGSVFEPSSLLALIIYPLVAWLIVRVIRLAAERNATA